MVAYAWRAFGAPVPFGERIPGMSLASARAMAMSNSRGSKTRRSRKTGARRYGAKASSKVERSMHEMKRGQLRSGRSGRKVTSRKQAIAIGLSEARRAGGKVPAKRASR